MTSSSRRRVIVAAAMSAVALTACTATGPGKPGTPVSPQSPDALTAAAAAYIARHPARPIAGMESGILISSQYAGTTPPSACGSTCWSWSGTVVEAGDRIVQVGAREPGAYDCSSPMPPLGLDPLLNAYIYFPADSRHLCPPDGVIVIRRSAVGPGGPTDWVAT